MAVLLDWGGGDNISLTQVLRCPTITYCVELKNLHPTCFLLRNVKELLLKKKH